MSGPEPPKYTKYRARPALLRRRSKDPGDGLAELRGDRADGGAPPGTAPPRPRRRLPFGSPLRKPITVRRVLAWLALTIGAWLLVSLVAFLISAQIEQGKVSDATERALAGGGLPIGSPTTILVLGSDQRSTRTAEPGSSTSGPSRADSIMLLRVGGGANSRLSIARDTLVDIPGAGRQKINAAYAIGGAPLAIETVSGYLGIDVNHVVEVNFERFPGLVDAMGGINYRGGCVVARINGGYRNGGVTVRIRPGRTEHLNGEQALALARARVNECRPSENDLTRARRQQRILNAMRSRVLSPAGFIRLPWIGWHAPRAIRTDMSGPTLMAVFAGLAVGGSAETHVLGTPSGIVPEAAKQAAVEQFLDG